MPFAQALKLVETVLDNYEAWSVNFIKDKIKENIFRRQGCEYIESGFVLRCLLEYYRIERINRLKFTRKLYEQCGGIFNSISFDGFMAMFDWFQGTPIHEKVSLYRECFAVGHGNITPEVIFTVCTERKFYIKHLRLSCLFKFPIHKGRKNFSEEEGGTAELVERLHFYLEPSLPALYDAYRCMKTMFHPDGLLYRRIQEHGIETTLASFDYFKALINKNRFFIESSALRGRHFIHFLSPLIDEYKRLAFSNMYLIFEARKESTQKNGEIQLNLSENEVIEKFAQELYNWESIFLWTEDQLLWKKKVNQFRENHCAKKIQRIIR